MTDVLLLSIFLGWIMPPRGRLSNSIFSRLSLMSYFLCCVTLTMMRSCGHLTRSSISESNMVGPRPILSICEKIQY